jgi:hypothetical protein
MRVIPAVVVAAKPWLWCVFDRKAASDGGDAPAGASREDCAEADDGAAEKGAADDASLMTDDEFAAGVLTG